MALKAFYDKKEDIPESVKDEYVERNGRFELSVDLGLSDAKTFTDFNNLNEALRKERKDHKTIKDRVALLGDRKIEDVVVTLDRVEELEAAAAGKIDEKKMNELVEGRIKARLAPVERERDQFKGQLSEKDKEIEGYKSKDKTRKVHDAVRKAATEAKVLPEALEDALLLADRHFDIDESGNVVTKSDVGVTPGIGPSVWFTDLQKTRAHWWGASAGGGAGGNRGGGEGMVNNPWSHEHWNMTEQSRIFKENRPKAEQLAKAAGTTIGGMRPQPPK